MIGFWHKRDWIVLLDGLFTFMSLISIEAYRGLIETSNIIISLFIIRNDLIAQTVHVYKHIMVIIQCMIMLFLQ